MNTLVIDASVALKWVLAEPDAQAALFIRRRYHLIAPELLLLECANTFWKRVRRKQLTADEALVLTNGIVQAGIEFVSVRSNAEAIAGLALDLDHPAYDCAYIAVALHHQCQFATADRRLIEAIRRSARRDLDQTVVLFTDLMQRDD